MRSKKSISKRFRQREPDKRVGIIIILLLLIGIVGTALPAFSAIGSDWAIDVKLKAVGYENNMHDISTLPSSADVYLKGNRIVTIDYDKSIRTGLTVSEKLIDLGVFGQWYLPNGNPTTTGLYPTVSHAVGNLFFCDATGAKTEAGVRYFEDLDGDDIGDLHYYYGFSVMFTTRGEVYYTAEGAGALVDNRNSGEKGWMTYAQLAPYKEIDARSIVALDLHSLTSTFNYQGVLNSVNVVGQRARYTIAESFSGVDDSIVLFNAGYDWLSHNMKGSASESLSPKITYSTIDSESTNYATIELGAKLAIGLDSPQELPYGLQQAFGSQISISILNNLINPQGYDLAGPINIYNVEYIFDLVIDVSLNGMPISDYMAQYAAGTLDGLLAAAETEEPVSIWVYVIIAVIALVFLKITRII